MFYNMLLYPKVQFVYYSSFHKNKIYVNQNVKAYTSVEKQVKHLLSKPNKRCIVQAINTNDQNQGVNYIIHTLWFCRRQ